LTPDDPLRAGELMVHLIESDDASHVARVYADLPKSSPGLVGAMQALARHIALGAAKRPSPNVAWVETLLSQSGRAGQQLANLDTSGGARLTTSSPAWKNAASCCQRTRNISQR
jgi:hypothetical protein